MIPYKNCCLGVLFFMLFFSGLALSEEPKDIFKTGESAVVQKGETVKSVLVVKGSAQIDGTVKGSVVTLLGNITVGSSGQINENALAIGGSILQNSGATIRGKTHSISLPFDRPEKLLYLIIPAVLAAMATLVGFLILISIIGVLALVILILTVFEKHVLAVKAALQTHPWKTLLMGLLAWMALPPILIFLILTLVGIPLAFLLVGVVMAASLLGGVGVGYWLGEEVIRRTKLNLKPVWIGLGGLFLLFLISSVPYVGILIKAAVLLYGLGAVILMGFRVKPNH